MHTLDHVSLVMGLLVVGGVHVDHGRCPENDPNVLRVEELHLWSVHGYESQGAAHTHAHTHTHTHLHTHTHTHTHHFRGIGVGDCVELKVVVSCGPPGVYVHCPHLHTHVRTCRHGEHTMATPTTPSHRD